MRAAWLDELQHMIAFTGCIAHAGDLELGLDVAVLEQALAGSLATAGPLGQAYLADDDSDEEDDGLLGRLGTGKLPLQVLVSRDSCAAFLEHLQAWVETPPPGWPEVQITMLKRGYFELRACQSVLRASRIAGQLVSDWPYGLGSLLDVQDTLLVRVVGALASFTHEKKVLGEFDDVLRLAALRPAQAGSMMLMTSDTLLALQIAASELHPGGVKRAGQGKEGFSLLALLSNCVSPGGTRALRQWALQPLTDLALLQHRQAAVAALLTGVHRAADMVQALRCQIARVRRTMPAARRIWAGRGTVGDWLALDSSMAAFLIIRTQLARLMQLGEHSAQLGLIHDAMDPQLDRVHQHLCSVLDMEAMRKCPASDSAIAHLCVARGQSATLDALQEQADRMPAELARRHMREHEALLAQHCPLLQGDTLFLPQIGHVLALAKTPASADDMDLDLLPGVPSEWEFQFQNAQHWFYATPCTTALDDEFGALRTSMFAIKASIAHALHQQIQAFEASLLHSAGAAEELDALLALAITAYEHGWARPVLTEEHVLRIKGGLHPLQAVLAGSTQASMPNDVDIAPGQAGRAMVVRGPNQSGKSVLLRMIGCVQYLAQIGSFVPAEAAQVGLVDRIFASAMPARNDSIARSTSSFIAETQHAARSLARATQRSLVLLDEWGTATHPADGAALLISMVQYLIQPQPGAEPDTPKLVIATHFHELAMPELLGTAAEHVRQFHMTVRVEHDADMPAVPKYAPQFKLAPGTGTASYGVACAKQAGLDSSIVRRAAALVAAWSTPGTVQVPRAALPSPSQAQALRQCAAEEHTAGLGAAPGCTELAAALDMPAHELSEWLRSIAARRV